MILIVDYNAGNLRSVKRACDAIDVPAELSADPERIRHAERIIFPGVGAAASAMETLRARGLGQALREAHREGVPILGICLGAQIVLSRSEEGDTECLGLLPGVTRHFRLPDPSLKIPHMGWSEVRVKRPHPLLQGLENGDELYFVHSFYPEPAERDDCYATADHGGDFCCAIGRDNLFAMQFHPEKSAKVGLRLLERFARWNGEAYAE